VDVSARQRAASAFDILGIIADIRSARRAGEPRVAQIFGALVLPQRVSVSPGPTDPRRDGNAIELKLREVGQLFNSLDPSPFKEKDLDDDAEEFIVEWARELRSPRQATLRLIVHLEKPLPQGQTARSVQEAIRHYFAYRASIDRLALRQLFQQGRTSLVIGVSFLSACLLVAELVVHHAPAGAFRQIVREGLTIGGWVAMWRPMEIYLYDWWPLRRHARLLDRLGRIEVEVQAPSP